MNREKPLQWLFGLLLLLRLLYPLFNSPLDHLYSDPLRHWENGGLFLHPSIMGSSDPFLYQLWIFAIRHLARGNGAAVSLACGILCAAMPYGWYRTLREVQPRDRALAGALLIGLIPESIGLYAYFMNETLLVSLLGFCFWMTLRSRRKGTLAAFVLAAALWTCAAFTRTIAVPMAAGCIAWLWATQLQRIHKALAAVLIALLVAIPAGVHAKVNLRFFAPLGNLYFNEIYNASGMRDIEVDFGPQGAYDFGSPSFYNPSFYPFSTWTTDRAGVASISIDLSHGRGSWIAEKERVARESTFPAVRRRLEDLVYCLFGQSWPNSDLSTVVGWLTVWTRWIWAPLAAVVAVAMWRGRYREPAIVVPLCALATLALLLLQSEGVMEGRFREPIDAILFCSAWLMSARPSPQQGSELVA